MISTGATHVDDQETKNDRESQRLFAAANEPKEFRVIDGAAHIDFHAYVGAEYERRIVSFYSRYLRE
ncbi:MAG: hypothetical protein GY835_04825 [bacterium]|nr:hypothetical protein [bacterium]